MTNYGSDMGFSFHKIGSLILPISLRSKDHLFGTLQREEYNLRHFVYSLPIKFCILNAYTYNSFTE